jgi:hypothetical protein
MTFDIGYNCILRRPFLLKFMAVIHTAYATMKMPGLNGIITIMANQQDTLACENVSLSHVRCFGEKTVQEQTAKTRGGSPPHKTSVTKSPTSGAPRAPTAQKGTYIASTSTQAPTDQKVDNKQKGAAVGKH